MSKLVIIQKHLEEQTMTERKFIFEEKFISYANVEIYAENEEDARLQFQNGNYQYYDVSDFTEGHELISVTEEEPVNYYQGA